MKVLREFEIGFQLIVYPVGQYGEMIENEKPLWESEIYDTRDEAIKMIDECPLIKKAPQPRTWKYELSRDYYTTVPYTEFSVSYTEKLLNETKVEK